MLEVNGVSRPVTSWGNTVGDALKAAGVSVGSNDLVQPGPGEAVRDGDTIVVRTSKAYTVSVDGQTRTLWTTASSADSILADAAPLGSAVSPPAGPPPPPSLCLRCPPSSTWTSCVAGTYSSCVEDSAGSAACPQKSHAIQLTEDSTKPENVAIPTLIFQYMKG